ncbi:hypothetical protein CR513_41537, partial [Mucuna pruriens]
MAKKLASSFESFTLLHVPRDKNECTYLLSKLASSQKEGLNRMVIQETISRPIVETANVCSVRHNTSWRDLTTTFLQTEEVPSNPLEAKKLRREATNLNNQVGSSSFTQVYVPYQP